MREVTIKVFSFDELKGEAKIEASYYIYDQLIDIERSFANLSLDIMNEEIDDDGLYKIPDEIPDIDSYSWGFVESLRDEIEKSKIIEGSLLKKLYEKYVKDEFDAYYPSDEDLEYYAKDNNLEFYSNGEAYKEN